MSVTRISALAATILMVATGGPARATLIGTQVTGELYFAGGPQNWFDPTNHFVPSGYLNTNETTVTIASNAVEFGFADSTARVTADFSGAQLVVSEIPRLDGNFLSLEMVFTDTAFSNLFRVADNFPNGGMTASVDGGVITLDWAGGSVTNGQSLQVVFKLNVPPSPRLDIQLTPTNAALLSWPAPSTGFTLQQKAALNAANWANVTNTTVVTNGQNQVVVSPRAGTQYYRLTFE